MERVRIRHSVCSALARRRNPEGDGIGFPRAPLGPSPLSGCRGGCRGGAAPPQGTPRALSAGGSRRGGGLLARALPEGGRPPLGHPRLRP
eukprot:1195402-Prorocentrum_minimum.AAC.1